MASIKVDYESFPAAVSQIRAKASDLNTNIVKSFKAIDETHSVWQGTRYNELVTKFSNITEDVNEILQLVVGDIPYTLEQIANNYIAADTETDAAQARKDEPTKVSITIPGKEILFIDSSAVDPYKSQVQKSLEGAKEDMNSISNTVNNLTWEGQAADSYKSRLSELKTSLTTSFDDISNSFTELSRSAQDEFEEAERKNDVLYHVGKM